VVIKIEHLSWNEETLKFERVTKMLLTNLAVREGASPSNSLRSLWNRASTLVCFQPSTTLIPNIYEDDQVNRSAFRKTNPLYDRVLGKSLVVLDAIHCLLFHIISLSDVDMTGRKNNNVAHRSSKDKD